MLLFRGSGRSPYPPSSRPTVLCPPKLAFCAYEIPQFTLNLNLRPEGARMPREEANITGKVKYDLQLKGFKLNCRGD